MTSKLLTRQTVRVKVLISQSRPTLCIPMNCIPPGSSVHGISRRQEYWSGLLFPFPRDLPNPEIESGSPTLQADSLPSELPGKTHARLEIHNCRFYAEFERPVVHPSGVVTTLIVTEWERRTLCGKRRGPRQYP